MPGDTSVIIKSCLSLFGATLKLAKACPSHIAIFKRGIESLKEHKPTQFSVSPELTDPSAVLSPILVCLLHLRYQK
ncbi:hypothetical protein KIPB_002726 [Kipferlia bialata]|uniref:Uncharacterized protein n=1 Tax=Kipferlia bialata TaxID=797122 RepID=A0A391NJJ3_9EUKA|nr:hypothetical protein KIPB_002726 [Kipferlia bialata]|eukprot:g2726.t1